MNQRRTFAETMLSLMEQDDKIVCLLGDIGVFAFREHMARWPLRCINVGVCEQAMVGMAAGLSAAGLYPVIHTIDSFLARRAYEFIRLDFGEQRLGGLFVSVGHDYDYESLGPSHHCPEGASLMRFVRGMMVWEPESVEQVRLQMELACSGRALAYIRLKESA